MTLRFLVPVACSALFVGGCEEAIEYGAFAITADDVAFTGTSADCGENTSAPEGDPNRGSFFFEAIADQDAGTLILVGQFPGATGVPAAGSFTVPDDLTLTVQVDGEVVEPIEGTITATEVGTGLEWNFSGTTNLRGTLLCDLE